MRIEQLFPIAQELKLLNGAGQPTDITLNCLGMESKAVREAAKRVHKASLNGGGTGDVDTLEKTNAEVVAACIVGWQGFENADGPIPYSHAKALEYMLMPELTFMREQVEAFVSERERFFRKGGTST